MLSGRDNLHHASIAALGEMHNRQRITKWAIDSIIEQANNFKLQPDTLSAANALQAKSIITKHGCESAQRAMEAIRGYSYFRKADIERLYRDILAGEFHPLQHGKQTEAFGNHPLGNSIVA